ncbi:MAG TPA: hypothetical protein ENH19_01950 [Actinobacteria bacterium]|nr:hypothetical protein [Actinomycetes bacterium]HEX21399.1 hypothetical protein [Actinomycetota bacterium]
MGIKERLINIVGGVSESQVKEALSAMQRQIEDLNYVNLSDSGSSDLSLDDREKVYSRCFNTWLKSPLAGQAVNLMNWYTFGRGISVKANDKDVNEVIQAFWNDKDNKTELTSHQAQEVKSTELQIFANIFFVLFVGEESGEVKISSINPSEIKDIITDPNNSRNAQYYKRITSPKKYDFKSHTYQMTAQQKILYYADWQLDEGDNVIKDLAEGKIFHVKINYISSMKFGVSELYRALDWITAHKKQLEDWATLIRALSRFAWKRKIKGSSKDIAAGKAQWGMNTNTGTETNLPPTIASILHENQNTDWSAVSPPKGATTSPNDSRQLKLMVSAATGIFEHYFGDPSSGNLATATAMELPMLKMFEARQQLWKDVYEGILQFVIDINIDAGVLDKNVDRTLQVNFPNIVEKEVGKLITSVVEAVNLGQGGNKDGLIPPEEASREVLSLLGVSNIDKILKDMYSGKQPNEIKKSDSELIDAIKNVRQDIKEAVNA